MDITSNSSHQIIIFHIENESVFFRRNNKYSIYYWWKFLCSFSFTSDIYYLRRYRITSILDKTFEYISTVHVLLPWKKRFGIKWILVSHFQYVDYETEPAMYARLLQKKPTSSHSVLYEVDDRRYSKKHISNKLQEIKLN